MVGQVSPSPRWRAPLLIASLAVHGALLAGVVIADLWRIEKLTPDPTTVALRLSVPIASAGDGEAATPARPRASRPRARRTPRTSVVRASQAVAPPELATPVAVAEILDPTPADDAGPVVADGDAGGDGNGPLSVGNALESLRVAGETQIMPPDRVREHMATAGVVRLQGIVRICLDADGRVQSTRMLRTTGHGDYDGKLLAAVATWRYRPYSVDGRAMPVCGTVRFVYVQW
jgi:TonB family protein